MWLIIFLLAFNLLIGTWNAYAVGMIRAEHALTKTKPPLFEHWVLKSAYFTSVVCFTFPLMLLALYVASLAMPEQSKALWKVGIGLTYIGLIVPAVGAGLIITAHSIKQAFEKDASVIERAVAVYNTGASMHNVYSMIDGVPRAFSMISEGLKAAGEAGEEGGPILGGAIALLVIALSCLVIATCGGYWITHKIAQRGGRMMVGSTASQLAGRSA